MRRIRLIALGCCACVGILANYCFAQVQAAQFASAFTSLNYLMIYNELTVTDPISPKIVVLGARTRSPGWEIYVFSLRGKQPRIIWHLSHFPPSVEVIDPTDLQIKYTDDGPVITLYGCAPHLCGGKGSAGAFTYFLASGKMCSVLANWDDRANRANFSYSCSTGALTVLEKGLLDGMLHEEGY